MMKKLYIPVFVLFAVIQTLMPQDTTHVAQTREVSKGRNTSKYRTERKLILEKAKKRKGQKAQNAEPLFADSMDVDVPIFSPPAAADLEPLEMDTQEVTQAPQAPPVEVREQIYLNFENAELKNFIGYMANLKKINLIPHKTIEGSKISLIIRKPLTIDQAWNIFYTVLEKAGFSIVSVGDVYKIVPKDKKNKEPLPAYINISAENLPDSDKAIRYVAFLENIKVSNAVPILKSMLDPQAMVIEQPEINGLIIADKSYNIKAAMKVINELDKTGLQEAVSVIRLIHADAVDVRDFFKGLIDEKQPTSPLARLLGKQAETAASYFSPTTKIIAEDRTNSLILLGTKDSIEKIEHFIKEYVDTQLKGVKSPLHVYELQYANAKQITEILKEAIAEPNSKAGQDAAKWGAVRGGTKYFKPIKIQADVEGNRLIVTATDEQDWKLLKETIKNLDKPQPQVAIEALIVVTSMNDTKELQGALRNKKHGSIGEHTDFQSPPMARSSTQLARDEDGNPVSLLGNMLSGLTGGLGSTVLTFGRENNIWGIFKMLQELTNTTIIAQPFLSITNKFESEIIAGTKKRVVAQTTTTAVQGFEDTDANLSLKVKPQINIDGIITLDIEVNLDEFTNPDGTEKIQRKLITNVSVADGQVLALGGSVRTKISEATSKTPILGDIPGLGWLFKSKIKQINKQNLLVFLSPTIIKPRTEPGINTYSRMKLDLAKETSDAASPTYRTSDPIDNNYFNTESHPWSHKVDDFSSARFQPSQVDIKNDPYYRTESEREKFKKKRAKKLAKNVPSRNKRHKKRHRV